MTITRYSAARRVLFRGAVLDARGQRNRRRFRVASRFAGLFSAGRQLGCSGPRSLKPPLQDPNVDMRTIVVAGQKGGTGKTTLVAHLAVAAEAAGDGPIVVTDTDPQRSLTTWWQGREASTPKFLVVDQWNVGDRLARLETQGFSYCFVDTAAALLDETRAFLGVADAVVLPVRPSPSDLWALGATLDFVTGAGAPHVFVVTRAKPRARLTAQSLEALSDVGSTLGVMYDRVDYAAALTDGRTAQETRPGGRAASETVELWTKVRSWVRSSAGQRKALESNSASTVV